MPLGTYRHNLRKQRHCLLRSSLYRRRGVYLLIEGHPIRERLISSRIDFLFHFQFRYRSSLLREASLLEFRRCCPIFCCNSLRMWRLDLVSHIHSVRDALLNLLRKSLRTVIPHTSIRCCSIYIQGGLCIVFQCIAGKRQEGLLLVRFICLNLNFWLLLDYRTRRNSQDGVLLLQDTSSSTGKILHKSMFHRSSCCGNHTLARHLGTLLQQELGIYIQKRPMYDFLHNFPCRSKYSRTLGGSTHSLTGKISQGHNRICPFRDSGGTHLSYFVLHSDRNNLGGEKNLLRIRHHSMFYQYMCK